MQSPDSTKHNEGSSVITTYGKSPYRYALIIGPEHEVILDEISRIHKMCLQYDVPTIIIGDGKQSFDILKELNALKNKVAPGAMVDIWCHGMNKSGTHYSEFSDAFIVASNTILHKLGNVLMCAEATSSPVLVSYYSCEVGALSSNVPEGMLTFLYASSNRSSLVGYNGSSIVRKLKLYSADKSKWDIIANEIAKSAETKILYYKRDNERFVYRNDANINTLLSYTQLKQEIETSVQTFRAKFVQFIQENEVRSTVFAQEDYNKYITQASYVAVMEEKIRFLRAMPTSMLTHSLASFAIKHSPDSEVAQCIIERGDFGRVVLDDLIQKAHKEAKYIPLKHLLAKTSMVSILTKLSVVHELYSTYIKDPAANNILAEIIGAHHTCLALTTEQDIEGLQKTYAAQHYVLAEAFLNRLPYERRRLFLHTIFNTAVLNGDASWEAQMVLKHKARLDLELLLGSAPLAYIQRLQNDTSVVRTNIISMLRSTHPDIRVFSRNQLIIFIAEHGIYKMLPDETYKACGNSLAASAIASFVLPKHVSKLTAHEVTACEQQHSQSQDEGVSALQYGMRLFIRVFGQDQQHIGQDFGM